MARTTLCEVCGNERDLSGSDCPFCGTSGKAELLPAGPQYKTVNLEKGMPLASQALTRLKQEISLARSERCRILVLIHGYGSSGRGGVIRQEVRAQLQYMQDTGTINDFVSGEQFSTRSGSGRQLLRRFPFLRQLNYLNRCNKGVTLVVL
jgi:hypothetical protein